MLLVIPSSLLHLLPQFLNLRLISPAFTMFCFDEKVDLRTIFSFLSILFMSQLDETWSHNRQTVSTSMMTDCMSIGTSVSVQQGKQTMRMEHSSHDQRKQLSLI